MKYEKILVIAPHADDEVLGCGGYLLHKKKEGAKIKIVIGTIGGIDKRQVFQEREREFSNVCKELGAEGKYLYDGFDAEMDMILARCIIAKIDNEIDEYKPDIILFNYKSRHQDHVKMYDCIMASLRLREGYMPKIVALYEYPFATDGLEMPNGGKWFHDITDVIDKKIDLFNIYKTQVRKSPSPLNENGIKKLAALRGIESGVEYAEMFYVQKMIV